MAETVPAAAAATVGRAAGESRRDRAELREITGPSAFGGDPRRFGELLWMLTWSDFRLQYANTGLGFLWTILRPLLFFGVIFLVLRGLLRFGRGIEDYGLILVLGLIMFMFFLESTNGGVRSVASKEGIVRKMEFPRIVIPLSTTLSSAMTLVLNLASVFPLLLLFDLQPHWTWLLFPLLLVALVVFTTAVTMILSVLFVRSEDTAQVWGLIGRMLLYATPILFPIETFASFSKAVTAVVASSPLALIITQARVWFIDPNAPTGVSEVGWFFGLVLPLVLGVALCVYAFRVFVRDAPKVAEAL
jgi:ABC-2 type transport system permease protein